MLSSENEVLSEIMDGRRSYHLVGLVRFLSCVNSSVCPERVKSLSEVCVCQRRLLISGQPGGVVHVHVCVRVCVRTGASWARTVPL